MMIFFFVVNKYVFKFYINFIFIFFQFYFYFNIYLIFILFKPKIIENKRRNYRRGWKATTSSFLNRLGEIFISNLKWTVKM